MANEIRLSASLVYSDDTTDELPLQIMELLKTIGTKRVTRNKVSVGFAAEEAIPLGEVTAPGYAIFINRDPTNFISLRVATGGAAFARLDAVNGFALLKLGSGAQAPYAIADSAACVMDYLICNV